MEMMVKLTVVAVILIICGLLTQSESAETKHRDRWNMMWDWDDYEYDRCPYNDYCSNYYDKCNSDKGYEVRCNKCSFFQTCMTDKNNIKDPCDDTYICKDIETFKQGKGVFAITIILTCGLVVLTVLSVCLCIAYTKLDKKLKKANNRTVRNAVATSYPVKPSYDDVRDNLVSPPPPYREYEATAPPLTSTFIVSNTTFRNNPPIATSGMTNEDKGVQELRVDISK